MRDNGPVTAERPAGAAPPPVRPAPRAWCATSTAWSTAGTRRCRTPSTRSSGLRPQGAGSSTRPTTPRGRRRRWLEQLARLGLTLTAGDVVDQLPGRARRAWPTLLATGAEVLAVGGAGVLEALREVGLTPVRETAAVAAGAGQGRRPGAGVGPRGRGGVCRVTARGRLGGPGRGGLRRAVRRGVGGHQRRRDVAHGPRDWLPATAPSWTPYGRPPAWSRWWWASRTHRCTTSVRQVLGDRPRADAGDRRPAGHRHRRGQRRRHALAAGAHRRARSEGGGPGRPPPSVLATSRWTCGRSMIRTPSAVRSGDGWIVLGRPGRRGRGRRHGHCAGAGSPDERLRCVVAAFWRCVTTVDAAGHRGRLDGSRHVAGEHGDRQVSVRESGKGAGRREAVSRAACSRCETDGRGGRAAARQ